MEQQDNVWYVYEDWTLEQEPRCFYVGKGDDLRLKRVYRNRHHTNIRKKYGYDRRVVLRTELENDAHKTEIQLIAERHTYVYDPDYNGIGTNYTTGGEGTSGHRDTDEQRKRRSVSQTLAWKDPDKTKNRISSRNRDSTNEKLAPQARESQLRNWQDLTYREKQTKAIKIAQNDPEVQAKRRESNRRASHELWQRKEHREKLNEIFQSDEYKQKMSNALRGKKQRCGFCKEPGHKHFTCQKKHQHETNTDQKS